MPLEKGECVMKRFLKSLAAGMAACGAAVVLITPVGAGPVDRFMSGMAQSRASATSSGQTASKSNIPTFQTNGKGSTGTAVLSTKSWHDHHRIPYTKKIITDNGVIFVGGGWPDPPKKETPTFTGSISATADVPSTSVFHSNKPLAKIKFPSTSSTLADAASGAARAAQGSAPKKAIGK